MNRKLKRTIIATGAIAALAAGGAAVAGATGGDDDATERPITGSALDRASAAALDNTSGRVTGTEAGDEESYYEVEVTRGDGSQVDVQLDRGFNVVSSEGDKEDQGGNDD